MTHGVQTHRCVEMKLANIVLQSEIIGIVLLALLPPPFLRPKLLAEMPVEGRTPLSAGLAKIHEQALQNHFWPRPNNGVE